MKDSISLAEYYRPKWAGCQDEQFTVQVWYCNKDRQVTTIYTSNCWGTSSLSKVDNLRISDDSIFPPVRTGCCCWHLIRGERLASSSLCAYVPPYIGNFSSSLEIYTDETGLATVVIILHFQRPQDITTKNGPLWSLRHSCVPLWGHTLSQQLTLPTSFPA